MLKFIIAVVLFSGLAYTQDSLGPNVCEKTYLLPNQIAFSKDSILVQHNNQWIPIESLHVDAKGIFFVKDQKETDWLHWKCPICGYKNSITSDRCVNCGN